MSRYAQIIVNISASSLDHPFTYRIPPELEQELRPGSIVAVPFGRGNTERKGYVIDLSDFCGYPDDRLKEVAGIWRGTDSRSGDNAIRLAAWMKHRYGSTMAAALKVVLPAHRQAKPVESRSVQLICSRKEAQEKLSFYIRKHQVARERLLRALIDVPEQPYSLITQKLHITASTLQAMQQQGVIRIQSSSSLRNPVRPESLPSGKTGPGIPASGTAGEQSPGEHGPGEKGGPSISLSPEQQAISDGVVRDFERAQQTISDGVVRDLERAQQADLTGKILSGEDYGGESLSGEDPDGKSPREESGDRSGSSTEEDFRRVSLIRGITGSGKTEVYISIIERIVASGRQAIMLIPEISLTYQTLIRFYRHFGNRVSVMNSTLSEGEKSDQFERARRGEIDVIIGPRSALFTPFRKLGVIVIDEEHENSYKNESMPKYHARDVAVEIARMQNAVVVLGSATPSLDSYYRAQQGEYRLYTLDRRLTGGTLPEVSIADMREELRAGNRSILSKRLAGLLQERLDRKEQTMLFLNRRGYSGFVSCRSCGYVPKCPHCSVSLSLHRGGRLVCHYCGYEERMPARCPECGSHAISGFRAGTEQIETMLKEQFPSARVLRMDADTTTRKGDYEKILSAFANEEADILVGTQMIVKGHDFPNVTLVGILLADLSLNVGDYRAAERTFQLLTQAAGRAGRGRRPGSVVIQTYEPENYSILHASRQDYEGFYQEEITYRRLLQYPPVSHMLAIQITSRNEDHAQLFAGQTRELTEKLTTDGRDLIIIGPAAASLGRLRDEYRYVLYIKCPDYDKLIFYKDGVEAAVKRAYAADPKLDVNFQFDFDPVNPY